MKQLIFAVFCMSTLWINAQTPEEMAAWQAYMTPSEVHQFLAKYDGEWTAKTTMWMAPGQDPIVGEGTMENHMILEGRYQESTYHGDFQGMPMEGRSMLAYDNATHGFTSTWIDNFGTGMMVLHGKWAQENSAILFEGFMVDPMSGNSIKVEENFIFEDDNTQVMEMYMYPEDQKFLSMRIVFKRKTNL